MKNKGVISAAILASLAGILALLVVLVPKLQVAEEGRALGSIMDGQGYNSTTTSSAVATTWAEARTVTGTSTRSGIFGSVIITKQTQVTTLNIYDATTTDITLRNNVATSSILLASFGTSTPVGTYVFDSNYKTGLIVDPTPIGGNMVASSTITWK